MRICVYCGSSPGRSAAYAAAADELARHLAERGIGIVYGGASIDTMGVLADAALQAGGEVIGVIPRQLVEREVAHEGLSDLRVVADMHERKALMAELSDAFVALPGGVGTLEELFETWTWGQLSLHHKPLGLLDVDGYFSTLATFADHMVEEGFLTPTHRSMLCVTSDPQSLLDHFSNYVAPPDKWAVVPAVSDGQPGEVAIREEHPPVPADEPPVDALAWVHIRDGRLLVVRSAGRDAFYLPGGKRKPGESDVQALRREVSEELALDLRADSLTLVSVIFDGAHAEQGRSLRMACYSGVAEGELTIGSEIVELAWVEATSATRCAPAARRLVDELHARGDLR